MHLQPEDLFLTVVLVWGYIGTLQSYRWKETPCTIVESHRRPNSDDVIVRYGGNSAYSV